MSGPAKQTAEKDLQCDNMFGGEDKGFEALGQNKVSICSKISQNVRMKQDSEVVPRYNNEVLMKDSKTVTVLI